MIAAVLGIITSRFAGPIALAGCAVLAFMLIGAKMETGRVNGDLKAQVAESQRLARNLDTCRTNVATLDKAITDQNAAVARWQAESAQRSEAAAKAVAQARKATVAANQRIGALMAAKSGADQCKSAEELIMGSVR